MLNQEQQGYIDMLRVSYPNILESTLREMLTQASWSVEQVESGVAVYNAVVATAPVQTIPSIPEAIQVKEPVIPTAHEQNVFSSDTPSPFAPNKGTGQRKMLVVALAVFLLLSAIGVAAYVAFEKFFPGKPDALTNENVLISVFGKLGEIETANYATEIKFAVVAREADAKPFMLAESPTPEVLAKLERDEDRLRDVKQITEALRTPLRGGDLSYPSTITGIAKKTADAQGVPYVYQRNPDGSGFTLLVTMETKEGVSAVSGNSNFRSSGTGEKVNGMTVTLTENDFVYFYGELKPTQPKLFGFFGLSEIEEMIPVDVSAALGISGTFDNSKTTPVDARLSIDGSATMGDAAFAFGAEGIKKGEKYYGIIHKMPAFFSGMSQIRGKWVSFTQADLIAQGYGAYVSEIIPSDNSEQKALMDKARAQIKTLLEIASQDGVVIITGGPEKITVGEKVFYKYKLALAKEKLVPFYEHATKALEQYGSDSILKKDAATLEYLMREDFALVFDYLKTNTAFTLLVDEKGFPAKSEIIVRYVPTSAARALKDHQLSLSTAFTFSEINESVKVDDPKESITLEDLMIEVTGTRKELLRLKTQETNVGVIRAALDYYKDYVGTYPSTLDELKKKRSEVKAIRQDSMDEYESILNERAFLRAIPIDLFTKKPFTYRAMGADFELHYEIELPAYTKFDDPSDFYNIGNESTGLSFGYATPSQLLLPRFVNGQNVATKGLLSRDVTNNQMDRDKDLLSDSLEVILATNPNKSDSDGDGFDDHEELTTLTNPLGPGKLDVKRSSFF